MVYSRWASKHKILMASPFFSSSSSDIDDSAIHALIAEATDACALEQIAKLNTAHLSDSPLSSNLETRFQKLKSFPGTNNEDKEKDNIIPRSLNRCESKPNPVLFEEVQEVKPENFVKPESRVLSPEIGEKKMSRSGTPRSWTFCCFGCSPGKMQRRGSSVDDEILSEFGSMAMKEHRRKLKKAWKEQEKVSREAEKMAKWVKQVSMEIKDAAAIDELLKEEFK